MKTARELFRQAGSFLNLDHDWVQVFGRLPTAPCLVAIHGPPGAGKTTLLVKLAGSLATPDRPVLYDSLEEGLDSPALSGLLRRLELLSESVLFVSTGAISELFTLVRERQAKFLVIDSLTMTGLSAEDLVRLSAEAQVSIFFSLQQTKGGDARGSLSVIHAADVSLRLERGGTFELEKSRFSSRLSGRLPWCEDVAMEDA